MAAARKAVEMFGGKGLRDELTDMGLGNHPGLFRMLARVGQAIAEDRSTMPGGIGPGEQTDEARRDKLYPTMNEDGTPRKVPA